MFHLLLELWGGKYEENGFFFSFLGSQGRSSLHEESSCPLQFLLRAVELGLQGGGGSPLVHPQCYVVGASLQDVLHYLVLQAAETQG